MNNALHRRIAWLLSLILLVSVVQLPAQAAPYIEYAALAAATPPVYERDPGTETGELYNPSQNDLTAPTKVWYFTEGGVRYMYMAVALTNKKGIGVFQVDGVTPLQTWTFSVAATITIAGETFSPNSYVGSQSGDGYWVVGKFLASALVQDGSYSIFINTPVGGGHDIFGQDYTLQMMITKTADRTYYKAGEPITYTVTLKNGGTRALSNVVLSDTLVNVTGISHTESFSPANNILDVALDSNDKFYGEVWTYTYTYTPTAADVDRGFLENIATGAASGVNPVQAKVVLTPLPVINISGTKTWVDNGNAYNTRPAGLTTKIYQSVGGGAFILVNPQPTPTWSMPAGSNVWTYTYSGMPLDDNGSPVRYRVLEEVPPNYTKTSVDSNENRNFTNTLTGSVDITVTKVWEDSNNQDGKRPASLPITLTGSDDVQHTYTLTAADAVPGNANAWTYTFTDLAKYYNGVLINYHASLTETIDAAIGYSLTTDLASLTLTNSRTPETTTITGTKTWVGEIEGENTRPNTIILTLSKTVNNVTTVLSAAANPYTWTKNDDNTWAYTYTNQLPMYEGGKKITYSVAETELPGYLKTSQDTAENRNFTNQLKTTTIQGDKTWSELVPGEERPATVDFRLYRTPSDGPAPYRSTFTTTGVNEHYKFDNLPTHNAGGTEYVYSVEEVTPTGYKSEKTGHNFHNTYMAHGELTLKGNKTFSGRPATEEDVFTIGVYHGQYTASTLPVTWAPDEQTTVAGSGGFTLGPIYFTHKQVGENWFTVVEKQGSVIGMNYDLTVYQVKVDIRLNGDQTLTITPSNNYNKLAFNNSYTATGEYDIDTELNPNKVLTGRELADQEFTFELRKEGALVETVKNTADNNIPFGKLSFTQDDIGKTYNYTIKEIAGTETGMAYDPMTLSFSIKVEDAGKGKLNLTVTKPEDVTFNNSYTATGEYDIDTELNPNKVLTGRELADQEFTFELLRGDETIQTAKNTADGNIPFGKLIFTQDDIGQTYNYTIKEIPGTEEGMAYDPMALSFSIQVADAGQGELALTVERPENVTFNNTFTPQTMDIAIDKQWADNNNAAGQRPASIQVQLMQNGVPVGGPDTISAANGWTMTRINLPIRDANNTPYIYTVREVTVPTNYLPTYQGLMSGRLVIVNTYETPPAPPQPPVVPGPGPVVPAPEVPPAAGLASGNLGETFE